MTEVRDEGNNKKEEEIERKEGKEGGDTRNEREREKSRERKTRNIRMEPKRS